MRVPQHDNPDEVVVAFTQDEAATLAITSEWLIEGLNREDPEFIASLHPVMQIARQEVLSQLSSLYLFLTDNADNHEEF